MVTTPDTRTRLFLKPSKRELEQLAKGASIVVEHREVGLETVYSAKVK